MDLGTSLVLVTGAAGWLGLNLLRMLFQGLPDARSFGAPASGSAVRVLVLSEADADRLRRLAGDRLQVFVGDLRRVPDIDRFVEGSRDALLLHLAGVIHPRRVRDFYAINVEGTRNLLRGASAAGLRRAVILSSNSPCGCNPTRDHLFDEDSPYRPYLHYGRSKMRMEQLARQFHEAGRLETVIVRAPWFYGPHQPARQTRFFSMIQAGKAPLVGDGNNRRSLAYVDNLSQGLLRAATTAAAAGRTYWVADERPYTMNEILDTVERLLENEFGRPCPRRRWRLPAATSGVARIADRALQGLGLYNAEVHVLSEMGRTIACTVDRARRELGYEPHIGLEEGMRRSLRWCSENGLLAARGAGR